MRALLAVPFALLLATGAIAQEATVPTGEFRDSYGTTLKIAPCGDGTDICGTLLDIQGKSRTPENLQFVNHQIMQAEMTAPGQWQGTVTFEGATADSKITLVAADTLAIQGCRFGLLCQTLEFKKI